MKAKTLLLARINFIGIYFVCFQTTLYAGTFDWRIGGETGPVISNRTSTSRQFLMAAAGSGRYQFVFGEHLLTFQGRGRYEDYNTSYERHAWTSHASTEYVYASGAWVWSLNTNWRTQQYGLSGPDVRATLYNLQSRGEYYFGQRMGAFAELRFERNISKVEHENRFASCAGVIGLVWSSAEYLKVFTGFLTERFFASTTDPLTYPSKNNGWRNGMETGLDYSGTWIINGRYIASWRVSKYTLNYSLEQEAHIVIGKHINERWGLYFLADYVRRDIPRENKITRNLLYTNSVQDNRAHIKLSYETAANQRLFIRAAYSQTEFTQKVEPFRYKTIVLGYEVNL